MLALFIALTLHATPLGDAVTRYGDLDYEGCVTALAPALARMKGASRAQGELYFALCQFALGRELEARRHLELALRLDGNLQPPKSASPKERELFDTVARAVAANPRPKRHATPRPEAADAGTELLPDEPEPELAPAEVQPSTAAAPVVVAPPVIVAPPTAPPEPKRSFAVPIVFTVAAAAASATALGFGLSARSLEQQGIDARIQLDASALRDLATGRALGANVSWAVAGGLLLGAVIAWLWVGLSSPSP